MNNSGKRHIAQSRNPDLGFVRKLKEYDDELEVWFNRVLELWQVFRKGHLVMTVQDHNHEYMPLDDRVLTTLRRGNWYIRGRKVFDEIEKANLEAQAKIDKDWRDFLNYNNRQLRKEFVKATEGTVGAINIPKEDVKIPDDNTLERRRKKRNANLPHNYKKKNVGMMKAPQAV